VRLLRRRAVRTATSWPNAWRRETRAKPSSRVQFKFFLCSLFYGRFAASLSSVLAVLFDIVKMNFDGAADARIFLCDCRIGRFSNDGKSTS
jgi:hypothetical protein